MHNQKGIKITISQKDGLSNEDDMARVDSWCHPVKGLQYLCNILEMPIGENKIVFLFFAPS